MDSKPCGPSNNTIQNLENRINLLETGLQNLKNSTEPPILKNPNKTRQCPEQPCDKRPEPVEIELPDKIWAKIFHHLSVPQMILVRLCCTRWRNIINGSPELVGKIVVWFPPSTYLNEHPPDYLLPNARKASLLNIGIGFDLPWWPEFGVNLVYLNVTKCRMQLFTLFEMLAGTPNLQRLVLSRIEYCDVFATKRSFRLNQLKELVLDGQRSCEVPGLLLDKLGQACPRLTSVSVTECSFEDRMELDMFLRRTQDRMKALKTDIKSGILDEIENYTRLKLSKFELHFDGDVSALDKIGYSIIRMAQVQPSIEHLLGIPGSIYFLSDIGTWSPKLKHIQSKVQRCQFLTPTFLAKMPNLEYLDVDFSLQGRLETTYSREFPETLKLYFCSCPNLTVVIIHGTCRLKLFRSWAQLFDSFQSTPHLQRVELFTVEVADKTLPSIKIPALQVLKLINCDIPSNVLDILIGLCSQLKELHVSGMSELQDSLLLEICLQLPLLKQLTIEMCPGITDVAVANMVMRFYRINQLNIFRCVQISERAIEQLKVVKGHWVVEQ